MLGMVLHRKGEKYCTHAVMTSRKTDKMLDKTSDLLLFRSAFNKWRYTEGSCKACISGTYKNDREGSNMYFIIFKEAFML